MDFRKNTEQLRKLAAGHEYKPPPSTLLPKSFERDQRRFVHAAITRQGSVVVRRKQMITHRDGNLVMSGEHQFSGRCRKSCAISRLI